ncbi:ice-binding family protein [Streptomyces sp. LZ34]
MRPGPVRTGPGAPGHGSRLTSITLTTGATINGQALARNGSVTMDTNTITRAM